MAKPKAPKFPHRPKDQKAIDEAQQVLKARYYDVIRSSAQEILSDAAEDHQTYEQASGYIDEQIHQTADGSGLVIYTHEALNTLVQSDNWQAIEDVGMDTSGNDLPNLITVAAYYAVAADLREQVEAEKDEYFTEDED